MSTSQPSDLTGLVTSLSARLHELEITPVARIQVLEAKIETLQAQNDLLASRYDQVVAQCDQLAAQIKELKGKLPSLHAIPKPA